MAEPGARPDVIELHPNGGAAFEAHRQRLAGVGCDQRNGQLAGEGSSCCGGFHRQASSGSTNAAKLPIANRLQERAYRACAWRRRWRQRCAACGSSGHGRRALRHSPTPAISKAADARPKTTVFCSERTANPGHQLNAVASTEPAPSSTRSAGRAQHTSVLEQSTRAKAARRRGANSNGERKGCGA